MWQQENRIRKHLKNFQNKRILAFVGFPFSTQTEWSRELKTIFPCSTPTQWPFPLYSKYTGVRSLIFLNCFLSLISANCTFNGFPVRCKEQLFQYTVQSESNSFLCMTTVNFWRVVNRKDLGVDIGIIYNAAQQKKFAWAANTPASFWKKYPN